MTASVALAVAALRTRWRAALLMALVFMAAATAATTAFAVHGSLAAPWDSVFESTQGAHVRVTAPGLEEARAIVAGLPDIDVVDESRRFMFADARVGDRSFPIALMVETATPTLDTATGPTEAGADGVRLEFSHAAALAVAAGDAISLQRADGSWIDTHVDAVVSSVIAPPYPSRVPGVAFITETERVRLGLGEPHAVSVGVRLRDHQQADRVLGLAPVMPDLRSDPRTGSQISTWREIRNAALEPGLPYQAILDTFSILLLGCAAALVAVTISGRVAADAPLYRLLAAAGSTPYQTANAATLEHTLAATLGGLVGGVMAWVGADPVIAGAGIALGVEPPGVAPTHLAVVVAVLSLAAAATAWPAALRVARRAATIPDTTCDDRTIRARGLLDHMPASVAIGLKDAFARPARAAVVAVVVCLATIAGVAALSMEATFEAEAARGAESSPIRGNLPDIGVPAGLTDDATRLRPLVYGLEALLVAVTASTLLLSVGLDARERRTESAMLAAAGFTPRQLASVRGVSVGGSAAIGATMGVPLGIGLFLAAYVAANGSTDGAAIAGPFVLLVSVLILTAVAVQLAYGAGLKTIRSQALPAALRFE